jgi:hypothetical protein
MYAVSMTGKKIRGGVRRECGANGFGDRRSLLRKPTRSAVSKSEAASGLPGRERLSVDW